MSTGVTYCCLPNMKHLPYANEPDIESFFTYDFVPMLTHSIKTLRKVSNLPITLFTDKPEMFQKLDINIERVTRRYDHASDKLECFMLTPYDTTIYLDCDTEILADPREIIDDQYDLRACRELQSDPYTKLWFGYSYTINTGVLVYKNNTKMRRVFLDSYMHADKLHQQGKLRSISGGEQTIINWFLYNNDDRSCRVDLDILPSKWNVRGPIYNVIKDKKILHHHGLHDPQKRAGFIKWANEWKQHCLDLLEIDNTVESSVT